MTPESSGPQTPQRLSHGTRYYRRHPQLERSRKSAERARWHSAFIAYGRFNPDHLQAFPNLRKAEQEFRRIAKEQHWLPPNHSAGRSPTREEKRRYEAFLLAIGRESSVRDWNQLYQPLRSRRKNHDEGS